MKDDIWLSYVLGHDLTAPLVRSSANVKMIDPASDTWPRIRAEKVGMLETLRDAGWKGLTAQPSLSGRAASES